MSKFSLQSLEMPKSIEINWIIYGRILITIQKKTEKQNDNFTFWNYVN